MKKKIFIVLHKEIFPHGRTGHRMDEMVFYVFSTMDKAVASIKRSAVAAYSWWEIQEQVLDDPNLDWPLHVAYFNHKGGKLKAEPYDKCVAVFKKLRAGKARHDPRISSIKRG